MMKFRNPWATNPVEAKANQHQPAVVAWLQANPGNKVVTLAELRAGLPAIAADLTRPVVNHILQNIGAEVDDNADQAA